MPGRTVPCGAVTLAAADVEAVARTARCRRSCDQSRAPHASSVLRTRCRGTADYMLVPCEGMRVCTQRLATCCPDCFRGLPLASPRLAIPPGLCRGSGHGQSLLPAGYPGPVACHLPWRVPLSFLALWLARSHSTGLGSKQTDFSPCLPCSARPSSQTACSSSLRDPCPHLLAISGTHWAHPTELSPVCTQHLSGL